MHVNLLPWKGLLFDWTQWKGVSISKFEQTVKGKLCGPLFMLQYTVEHEAPTLPRMHMQNTRHFLRLTCASAKILISLRICTVWSESLLVTQGNFMILSYTLSAQKTSTILRWCRNVHVSALISVRAFPIVSRVHQQGLRSACASVQSDQRLHWALSRQSSHRSLRIHHLKKVEVKTEKLEFDQKSWVLAYTWNFI